MTATIAGVIGVVLGAWLTFRFGVQQSRLKESSNRRLSWLEKAQAQLLAAAGDLQNARAADLSGAPDQVREESWTAALESIGSLRHLELEAEAYLPNSAAEAVAEAVNDIIHTTTLAARLRGTRALTEIDRLSGVAAKLIYHAASRVAGEIRVELGLDSLSREWRLYDREIRELRSEVPQLESPGRDSS